MPLREATGPAPPHLPADEEIARLSERGALVIFPDGVSAVRGESVAAFRAGAQELRVNAKRAGLDVEVVVPPGAKPGQYSEHDADWVLPLILSVPAATIATLIANQIQRWIDDWYRQGRSRTPTVRYREVVVDDDSSRTEVKEIEGPAEEVVQWLRERANDQADRQ
jgi:hypothetical protein